MIVSQTTSVVGELCSTVVAKDHHSFASPPPDSITPHVSRFQTVVRCSETLVAVATEPAPPPSISLPCIRSGSFADIGSRRTMEDEHICIDDLSSCLGPAFKWAGAFYAVFDGHGGSAAASYVKRNAMRLFFQDVDLPDTCSTIDSDFLDQLVNCHRKAFLLADVALAAESSVSSTCGTTALTALVIGRHLLIANAGDCRAVLCRKGVALDMSQDHRPSYLPERQRVVKAGGYVDDEDYLNGELSVTRALGDWFMKLPFGSASPLIADPDVRQVMLTEDDEFLIICCDGIWDVLPSQAAVSLVRRGLRRHDDPDMCARELVMEASRLDSNDNLTAVVICFSSPKSSESCPPQRRRLRFSDLSEEAPSRLKSLLEGN